ncbi:peptidoglycan-binding domain-containing protein [Phyllobacterium sp. CCNWLW109]|uniref:peptidoglycan-binding domain-containing protein n=1 Tax=Phyllobacterium sp. CCNWLW109 TaxID=3127479 RepID=UPI003076E1B2
MVSDVAGKGSSDLLSNPFVLLSITPSASKEQVAEAFDERLADGLVSEQALRDARRVLLIPNQRLIAELSYLIDTPVKSARLTIERIRKNADTTDLMTQALTLPPLSRLNVLGHIGSISSSCELLIAFVEAQAGIDTAAVVKRCGKFRADAGMSPPAEDAVERTVLTLVERHCKSIFGRYSSAATAADDVLKCVEHSLRTRSSGDVDSLAWVLKAYSSIVVPDQSKYAAEIEASLDAIKKRPDDTAAFAQLQEALKNWDRLSQPLQLFEQSLDRDEPESRRMFEQVRGAAIDLANNSEAFEAAQAISRLCLKVFAELPRAVAQVQGDLEILDSRVLESAASPLANLVEKLGKDHRALAFELKRSGFDAAAKGVSGQLYAAFQSALSKTHDTKVSDLPWTMLRNLALVFNNEHNDPVSSLAIIEGMVDHPKFASVSNETRNRITADEVAVRENVLELELNTAIKSNDLKKAEQAAERLSRVAADPKTRAQYAIIHRNLSEKNRPKSRKFAYIVIAVVAVIIAVNVFNEKPNSSYRPASTSAPTTRSNDPISKPLPQASRDSGREVQPNVGINSRATVENIRYCMRESERLEIIRSMVTGLNSVNEIVDAFNFDINDLNSRCSNYSYLPADMDKVKAEMPAIRSILRKDAEQRLAVWRAIKNPSAPVPSKPAEPYFEPTQPEIAHPVSEPASLDLLKLEDASIVQSVLSDLGYFDGPTNGTWGQKSRRALGRFKRANGLADNDGFDAETEAKLFGDAIRSEAGDYSDFTTSSYTYPPPPGARLNPLNPSDAIRINNALAAFGIYKGKQRDVWSGLSRDALTKFKISNGLPDNAVWDWRVEQLLLAGNP